MVFLHDFPGFLLLFHPPGAAFFFPGLKSCVSDGAVLRRFCRGMNGYSAPAERAGGLKVRALLGVMKNLAGLQGGTPQE